jgi:hypothetical protein
MLCGIAGHAVDPDQVRPTTVSERGGTFTDLLAFRPNFVRFLYQAAEKTRYSLYLRSCNVADCH